MSPSRGYHPDVGGRDIISITKSSWSEPA